MARAASVTRKRSAAPRPAPRPNQSAPIWRRPRALALGVALIAIAASIVGLFNYLVGDDQFLVDANPLIQDFSGWRQWFTSPYWPPPASPDLYRPITTAMFAIQHAVGGGLPFIYHVVSYVLYAACAVGAFALAKRMMSEQAAWVAAALFAAHPVHVEAVAPAVGQSELVVGLIALVMVVRYVDRRRAGSISAAEWVLFCGLYLVASLTKEQGLILPGLLVIAELHLVERRRDAADYRALALGFAAMAVVAVGIVVARRAVLGDAAGSFTAEALQGVGMRERFLTMLRVVIAWTRLLLWPVHLQADYSASEILAATSFGWQQLYGALIACVAVALWIFGWKKQRALAFGIAWTAITLFPVSNVLVPTGIVLAERTLFLPSVGVVLVAGIAGQSAWRAFGSRIPAAREIVGAALGGLIGLGILRSAERERVWRNEIVWSARMVQDAPRSYKAQTNFGIVMFFVDQPALARDAFRQALEYAPPAMRWRVHNDYAKALGSAGQTAEQMAQLQASLRERPAQPYVRAQLAVAQLLLGKYAEARAEADSGLAAGANVSVFTQLESIADSAMKANAPAGSIRFGLNLESVTRAQ